jgi:hypothetical protein
MGELFQVLEWRTHAENTTIFSALTISFEGREVA